jgi:hypothetical protein
MRHRLILISFCWFTLCCLALPPLVAEDAPHPAEASASGAASTEALAQAGGAAALLEREFGKGFHLDESVAPLFGDLNGDGSEDVVLVATSARPLEAQEEFRYRVEDPYDGYFGVGDVKITSKFTLHFDGSGRDLIIVLGWRQPPPKNAKHVSKYVLINTPFESVRIARFVHKKKTVHVIEVVDSTELRAHLRLKKRHWRWSPQGEADELSGYGGRR